MRGHSVAASGTSSLNQSRSVATKAAGESSVLRSVRAPVTMVSTRPRNTAYALPTRCLTGEILHEYRCRVSL